MLIMYIKIKQKSNNISNDIGDSSTLLNQKKKSTRAARTFLPCKRAVSFALHACSSAICSASWRGELVVDDAIVIMRQF